MNDKNVIPFSYRVLINSFRSYKDIEDIVRHNIRKGTISSFCLDQYLKAEEEYLKNKKEYLESEVK